MNRQEKCDFIGFQSCFLKILGWWSAKITVWKLMSITIALELRPLSVAETDRILIIYDRITTCRSWNEIFQIIIKLQNQTATARKPIDHRFSSKVVTFRWFSRKNQLPIIVFSQKLFKRKRFGKILAGSKSESFQSLILG